MKNFLKDLHSIEGVEVLPHQNLTKYNTFKILSFGDLLKVKDCDGLYKTVNYLDSRGINYFVLGKGSNLVLPNEFEVPIIKLEIPNPSAIFDHPKDSLTLSASTALSSMISYAISFCIQGWEVFTGIPATLGGAIAMNAGTKFGEIGSLVNSVEILDSHGEVKIHKVTNESFSYRQNNFLNKGDIILSATLNSRNRSKEIPALIREYLELRKKSQPLNMATCGCVFKNFTPGKDAKNQKACLAGQCIDILGIKGWTYNGKIRVSPVHGNFFENLGNATQDDFVGLVNRVNDEVEKKMGFRFELEVEVL